MDEGVSGISTGGSVLHSLDRLSDSDLREVVKKGEELLAARENERKQEALDEIKRLAKEHGLKVSVNDPTRKRGRPSKPKEGV